MKKLVLALVCLVSVAFFASCTPEGNPSISVLNEEGYIQDGAVVEYGDTIYFGFLMTSSIETNGELTSLVVKIDDEEFETVDLTGTTYTYRQGIVFEPQREDENDVVISAVVTDVYGKEATASITFSINPSAETELVATAFEWNRHGGAAATGNLADLGLAWNGNTKESFVILTPLEGAAFYRFDTEAERDLWGSITTSTEKAALFSEVTVEPITEFKEVSCTAEDKDYNFVLGTVYNGEYNLIHITHSHAFVFKGTDVTISGEWK